MSTPLALRVDSRKLPKLSVRTILVIGVAILVLWSVGGWLLSRDDTTAKAVGIEASAAGVTEAPDTKEGAVSAATSFFLLYGDVVESGDVNERADFNALLTDAAQKELRSSVDSTVTMLHAGGARKIQITPVAFRVTSSTENSGQVEIIASVIASGNSKEKAVASTALATTGLYWNDNHWVISSFSVKSATNPSLPTGNSDGTSASLNEVMKQFSAYGTIIPAESTESSSKGSSD